MSFAPTKLYYKIGEVCRIVGVEAYVLRYWETEFAALAPPKNKGGQRTYRARDIELLLEIRRLLYEEGFTIAGARKRLGTAVKEQTPVRRTAKPAAPRKRAKAAPAQGSKRLNEVRAELENILTLLDRE